VEGVAAEIEEIGAAEEEVAEAAEEMAVVVGAAEGMAEVVGAAEEMAEVLKFVVVVDDLGWLDGWRLHSHTNGFRKHRE